MAVSGTLIKQRKKLYLGPYFLIAVHWLLLSRFFCLLSYVHHSFRFVPAESGRACWAGRNMLLSGCYTACWLSHWNTSTLPQRLPKLLSEGQKKKKISKTLDPRPVIFFFLINTEIQQKLNNTVWMALTWANFSHITVSKLMNILPRYIESTVVFSCHVQLHLY